MAKRLSLAELLSSVPLADWKDRLVKTATAVGLSTENWAEGGLTRTFVALFAELYKSAGDVIPNIAASHFLDLAEGPWLTLLARQVFGVERIEATYAAAPLGLTLTNTSQKLYLYDPKDLICKRPGIDRTFRNSSGGALTPGGTLKLDVIADEPGSGSQAPVGTITELVTTFLGVTCTNTVALVGLDEQGDPELRELCRDSRGSLGNGGTKRTYAFYAKTARRANGGPIGVSRVKIPPAIGDGTGTVYLASAGGVIPAEDVAVIQKIFDGDEETPGVTHYGFTATAASATVVNIAAPCTVWIPQSLGIGEETAQEKVNTALIAYVASIPIGGVIIAPAGGAVFWRKLLEVISGAIPGTLKAELASEADTALTISQVPVFNGVPSDTTVNIVEGV
jgi:uncharacterized phage protein gp47/JayE